MDGKKLKIMVSSTVFGVEELLDRVYTLLTSFGYEVWMSHKGTVPVFSEESAFESCLMAVEKCDLFLGIITPQYGSGVDKTGISITHKEIKRAVELKKPRWFLAHDHVVFARRLLADLGHRKQTERHTLTLKPKSTSITDLKVIDMYEDATMEHLPLDERQGNWVQKYERDDDANLFVVAQFSRYQDVEQRLLDHLGNSKDVAQRLRGQDE
ncbi:DUF4062 domain-containing protein [Pseudomonas cichorii]|uniref:DUF4062 domain-containing protein n=1 Tax=Pseudomonas lijiangensis TaxID=2995658 RepID=A0ABX8HRR9_9PSED|nr:MULTISPECIES: DUF4062 domain-containing protein [Pseudomonas syringae group]MBX8501696.1 DUF4062 domain-containing protein [Pseudomonas lijiangensis]MBX8506531.1 DUF4062 domain-containing protein [Pseudomonas lijiangensis]MBX8522269.1 DUF4062 domain-containing protein [Pseudomonas cichorii]MBX8542437.1 DUF4062 domain-containing protein [Pseudomonas cichorii]MBX8547329.1 DUF4062 domain-containing protein [Pseudomonas cichorii]